MAGQKLRSGGKRPGAGRRSNADSYGEEIVRVRVPESWVSILEAKKQQLLKLRQAAPSMIPLYPAEVTALGVPVANPAPLQVPLFQSAVQAGFPSPAEDYVEGQLDFNALLIKRRAATFCVKVTGLSMLNAGIHPGDILVVDRSIDPQQAYSKIVIAAINGELTVKRLVRQGEHVLLQAENPHYPPIALNGDMDIVIWGVVTGLVRNQF